MSSDERVLRGITAGFPPPADEGEGEGVPCLGIGKASTKSQVALGYLRWIDIAYRVL